MNGFKGKVSLSSSGEITSSEIMFDIAIVTMFIELATASLPPDEFTYLEENIIPKLCDARGIDLREGIQSWYIH